ncbi:hypothetical protein HDE_04902 [Halotydeus destructor]|nr:hypothetical protein HDE_04902 [Halotydeus destructor]
MKATLLLCFLGLAFAAEDTVGPSTVAPDVTHTGTVPTNVPGTGQGVGGQNWFPGNQGVQYPWWLGQGNVGQGNLPVGQGNLPVGQGKYPVGQGNFPVVQGNLPSSQGIPLGQVGQGSGLPQQGVLGQQQLQGQQLPGGQYPVGQFQGGQVPVGQFQGGQFPVGQFQGGQFPGGQLQGGQYPGGQLQGGQFQGGQYPWASQPWLNQGPQKTIFQPIVIPLKVEAGLGYQGGATTGQQGLSTLGGGQRIGYSRYPSGYWSGQYGVPYGTGQKNFGYPYGNYGNTGYGSGSPYFTGGNQYGGYPFGGYGYGYDQSNYGNNYGQYGQIDPLIANPISSPLVPVQ